MKLLLLIILLCGINSSSDYAAKAKKPCASRTNVTASFDMVPSSILFQF